MRAETGSPSSPCGAEPSTSVGTSPTVIASDGPGSLRRGPRKRLERQRFRPPPPRPFPPPFPPFEGARSSSRVRAPVFRPCDASARRRSKPGCTESARDACPCSSIPGGTKGARVSKDSCEGGGLFRGFAGSEDGELGVGLRRDAAAARVARSWRSTPARDLSGAIAGRPLRRGVRRPPSSFPTARPRRSRSRESSAR